LFDAANKALAIEEKASVALHRGSPDPLADQEHMGTAQLGIALHRSSGPGIGDSDLKLATRTERRRQCYRATALSEADHVADEVGDDLKIEPGGRRAAATNWRRILYWLCSVQIYKTRNVKFTFLHS